MVQENSKINEATKRRNGSFRSIFMHADRVDMWLMAFGFLGAIFDGLIDRLRFIFATQMITNIANASKLESHVVQHNLDQNALAMLYSACLSFVACYIEGYCWTRTGERQASRMRSAYLKAVLRQDFSYFDMKGTSTSEVITSISNDSLIIQDVIGEKIPDTVSKISTFVASYIVAFILLWQLAIVSLPLALLLVLPGWLCGRSLTVLSSKIGREYGRAGTIAEQAISSIRTVYAFVGEPKTMAQFSAALQGSLKLGLRQGLVKGLAIGSGAIMLVIWSFMSYYGSRLVMYHGAQGGAVYCAGLAIILGGLSLSSSLSNLKDITEACYVSSRVMVVIKRTPKIDSQDMKGLILENVLGEVKFNQVSFSYPSRPESVVLKTFSLAIPAGKTVALVGPSGSGKSTTLSLLQRFYDPLEGEILLDGIAIDKLQLKWLRSQMAMVSQEPSLLSTTIKENILFGKVNATMDDILETSVACDVHSFVAQLPQGYDTQVGERGVQLSGGQKQRIAIARAIIRKPRILLLDEATSALDSESESNVQEAIDKVVLGRTTIIIAHRLSTIKNADIIAVVENGQIVEMGSHDELIRNGNGVYNSLVHLQRMVKTKQAEQQSSPSPSTLNSGFNNTIDGMILNASKSNSVNSREPVIPSSLAIINENSKDLELPKHTSWRLLALGKPEWKQASIGCCGAVLLGAIQPVYSVAMGTTMSVYYLTEHDQIRERISNLALVFLALSVFSFISNISRHYSFAYVGEHVTKRIRETMLSKVLTFEVGWFDQEENSSGVIFSRLTKDANLVRSLVADKISLLIEAISVVTMSWTIGLVISWRLGIVSIAFQPLIIACCYARCVLLKSMCRIATKAQYESTKLAVEAVSNLRIVNAFSVQDQIIKLLEKAQEGVRRESVRQSHFAGMALGFSVSMITCNWSLNCWYGGKLVLEGHATPRAVFQTIVALLSICRILVDIVASTTTILSKASEATKSIFSILERETLIEPENQEGYQPDNIEGQLELCDVHFSYPTRPNVMIFQGFSIFIEAGKSVALVGKSGSGKSTILSLIERFYDPSNGVVKIDGRDIRSYNLRSLRNHIALVNQEPTLFAGTIRENITYGLTNNVAESEVIEAAKAANIHDFIARQQDGYDTRCGDKGLQLSGGQKQRVAIARAMLRNPSVLLLDEATSALDSHSEKVVQRVLEQMMKGRTSVVVAHRLCTIQSCDEIVVLEKGKVVEKGTHSSLMGKGNMGMYYSLASVHTMEE